MNVYRYRIRLEDVGGRNVERELTVPTREGVRAADRAVERLAAQWARETGARAWTSSPVTEGER